MLLPFLAFLHPSLRSGLLAEMLTHAGSKGRRNSTKQKKKKETSFALATESAIERPAKELATLKSSLGDYLSGA